MPQYFLVEQPGKMPRWCELADDDGGMFWIDFKARRIPREDGNPLAVVEAENQFSLLGLIPREVAQMERDFAAIHLLDPYSNQGWVARNGRFYGCAYYAHDDLAYSLLARAPGALEFEGWVRVHSDSFRMSPDTLRNVTPQQEATLLALGFADPRPPGDGRRWVEPDRGAPPPRYAYTSRAAPVPETVVETEGPVAETDVRVFAASLMQRKPFSSLSDIEPEVFVDFGGRWLWMLDFGDFQIGSCETPVRLDASPGLTMSVPGHGQIELDEWPYDDVEPPQAVMAILARIMPSSAPSVGS